METHKTHKQHEKEVRIMKDQITSFIVARKYFKTNSPNFLTYSEKEQIRKLHDEDADLNTEEHLSKSFPADPHTIKMIIRNRWQPRDTKRIQKHDEAVKQNWDDFKAGKLNIDPVLAEHLKKFAFRDFNYLNKPPPYRKLGVQIPKPYNNEFSSIITSCKKYADNKDEDDVYAGQKPLRVRKIVSEETRMPQERPIDDDENSVMLEGKREFSRRDITLEEFQKKAPAYKLQQEEKTVPVELKIEDHLKVTKFKKDLEKIDPLLNSSKAPTVQNLPELKIPTKIRVPPQYYLKGKILKVKDCFYDDDGEFLYRVPGLK